MRNFILILFAAFSISLLSCNNSSEPNETDNSGLKATYSTGVTKIEKVINHGWLVDCGATGNNYYQGTCTPVESSPVDWAWGHFNTTWTGDIYIPEKGEYTFSAWVDGTVYIAVNDSVVADFNTVGSPYSKTLTFEEAAWYPISMKFTANGGSNYMWLGWVKPGADYETVPGKNLRHE